LLGPNGAGKTTLIRCVMGLLRFKGNITYHGLSVNRQGSQVRSLIGYVPQQSAYHENLSVISDARLFASLKNVGRDKVDKNLKRFDLWQYKDKKIKSLSSGMRQRLGVALALLSDPPLMIFDEPTTNLDIRNQVEFQAIIKELSSEGKTLLMATHLSGLDKQADRAIIMDSGKVIADDTPGNLMSRIGTRSEFNVRPKSKDFDKILSLLEGLGVEELEPSPPWISFIVSGEKKSEIMDAISRGGYSLEDFVVEPSSIESQYQRLIGGNGGQ
ncbi:MAG: ABC transporter ATP-binding protein, partial [Thaumarchaeota archaeon]|nr:ABC transporter ATP-binding protein [Nitrososphaerota archaeon]